MPGRHSSPLRQCGDRGTCVECNRETPTSPLLRESGRIPGTRRSSRYVRCSLKKPPRGWPRSRLVWWRNPLRPNARQGHFANLPIPAIPQHLAGRVQSLKARWRRSVLKRRSSQHHTLIPNWICRDEPASPVGNRVRVILPNVGLPTMLPGGPKFAWLKRLKMSTRNCTRAREPVVTFLMTERSVLWKPGPATALRARFPKRLTAANAEGSNHRSTDPMIWTGAVRSGRTVLGVPLRLLLLVTMLTGLPLCDWTTVASCQPRVSACPLKGNS